MTAPTNTEEEPLPVPPKPEDDPLHPNGPRGIDDTPATATVHTLLGGGNGGDGPRGIDRKAGTTTTEDDGGAVGDGPRGVDAEPVRS